MRKLVVVPVFLILAGCADAYAKERDRFELRGKVFQGSGKLFIGLTPVAYLSSTISPFMDKTPVGLDGKFKFKNLRKGVFTLTVVIPRVGELTKTVDVGPSFADSKSIIHTSLQFDVKALKELKYGVALTELSIPEPAREEYGRARDRLAHNDAKGAIEHLKKAVVIAPQFASAWNNLGTISHQAKQYLQAEEYFREALKYTPDSYFPLVNLGGTLLVQNKSEESLKIGLLALKAKPNDPLAHTQLGLSYLQLGQMDDAEKQLQQAIALEPGHFSFPQLALATIYRHRMDFPAEILVLEEFLKFHPDSDRAPAVQRELKQAKAKSQ